MVVPLLPNHITMPRGTGALSRQTSRAEGQQRHPLPGRQAPQSLKVVNAVDVMMND